MERDSNAFAGRKRRTFMFYIVCDVSRSMWDPTYTSAPILPYDVLADALPELIAVLDEDAQVRDIGRLSIIAFADKAELVVPLTPLRDVKAVPALPKGTETDYRSAFEFLNKQLRADADVMQAQYDPYRPVVYFITDGDPQKDGRWQGLADWKPARDRLSALDFVLSPSVVALGLGDVNPDSLKAVASTSPPGAACVAEGGEPVAESLRSMLGSIVVSVTNSSETGELEFETPRGMRRLL